MKETVQSSKCWEKQTDRLQWENSEGTLWRWKRPVVVYSLIISPLLYIFKWLQVPVYNSKLHVYIQVLPFPFLHKQYHTTIKKVIIKKIIIMLSIENILPQSMWSARTKIIGQHLQHHFLATTQKYCNNSPKLSLCQLANELSSTYSIIIAMSGL